MELLSPGREDRLWTRAESRSVCPKLVSRQEQAFSYLLCSAFISKSKEDKRWGKMQLGSWDGFRLVMQPSIKVKINQINLKIKVNKWKSLHWHKKTWPDNNEGSWESFVSLLKADVTHTAMSASQRPLWEAAVHQGVPSSESIYWWCVNTNYHISMVRLNITHFISHRSLFAPNVNPLHKLYFSPRCFVAVLLWFWTHV